MLFARRITFVFISLMLVSCESAQSPSASHYQQTLQVARSAETELIAFRHDLHRHPELSGEELRTSGKVADTLSKLGFDVRTNVGGYGVVAVLQGDKNGPMIAFRADMDAVADKTLDPVPYASEVDGVRHICGHDIHTTIGIGLAKGFAATQARLPGNVMLIFQPAEEAGTGAEAMLADNLFGTEKPNAIFAVHTAPFDVGALAVLPNGMMAGRTLITVSASGDGDVDQAVKKLRAALKDAGNITPETMLSFTTEPFIFIDLLPTEPARNGKATVSGFGMSAGLADRPRVEQELRQAVASVKVDGVDLAVTFKQALEGVNNDPDLVDLASTGIAANAPDLSVFPLPGVIPAFSEDFGSFQRSVPGVLYFLGVNNPDLGTVGFPHSPDYVADDGAILVGVEAMLAAMLEAMAAN